MNLEILTKKLGPVELLTTALVFPTLSVIVPTISGGTLNFSNSLLRTSTSLFNSSLAFNSPLFSKSILNIVLSSSAIFAFSLNSAISVSIFVFPISSS